jgi:hypothetical protein
MWHGRAAVAHRDGRQPAGEPTSRFLPARCSANYRECLVHGGAAPGLVGVLPLLWGECGPGGGDGFGYLRSCRMSGST